MLFESSIQFLTLRCLYKTEIIILKSRGGGEYYTLEKRKQAVSEDGYDTGYNGI